MIVKSLKILFAVLSGLSMADFENTIYGHFWWIEKKRVFWANFFCAETILARVQLISFHEVACPSNWENSDEIGKIDLRFKGGDMLKTLKNHDQNLHKLELMSRVGLPFNYNGCIWTKKITKF